jgi:hypothetical protein
MDLRKMRWKGMEWIEPALENDKRRGLVNTVKNLRVT